MRSDRDPEGAFSLGQFFSVSKELLTRLRRALVLLMTMGFGMAVSALGLAYLLAGEIYDYQDTFDGVHLPEVDAIVCLAGGRGRIAAAGDLWYRYWEQGRLKGDSRVPVLFVSGMGPYSNWGTLAQQLRRGVLEVIRPENVVLETESFNTDANARWLARYARERGWERILLVTSPYHMKRSRLIFERTLAPDATQGLEKPLRIETFSVYQEPFEPNEWRSGLHGIRVTITEYLKWIYYRSFWRPEGALP
jgi:uncharacterized SAM-binding protein YcdF (DUF218 family)